jgi:hypothetical protein
MGKTLASFLRLSVGALHLQKEAEEEELCCKADHS